MQKQHLVADFPHGDREVAHGRQFVGQLRELMIVGRKDGLAADNVVQMFADAPCDRYAVVRARAAADLIEQHEGTRGGRMQNRARFAHLDHERALPAHEVIARTDACEQAVDDRQSRATRRHVSADLGE